MTYSWHPSPLLSVQLPTVIPVQLPYDQSYRLREPSQELPVAFATILSTHLALLGPEPHSVKYIVSFFIVALILNI